MAQTKKNTKKTTKAKGGKKSKAKDSEKTFEVNENVFVDIYKFKTKAKTRYTAKITLCNAFVIYCNIVLMNDDGYAFLSYPSYQTKNGDYKNLAYCFDKDIIEDINDELTDFFFGEDEDDEDDEDDLTF